MASEMRRLAKLLIDRHDEAFESRYPREESMQRVERALEGFCAKGMVYKSAWRDTAGPATLDVSFAPSPNTRFILNSLSLVLSAMLVATVWALSAPGEVILGRALLSIGTLLALLAFPFVIVAFASRREAEEATLRRRLRKAIVDEEELPRKKAGSS